MHTIHLSIKSQINAILINYNPYLFESKFIELVLGYAMAKKKTTLAFLVGFIVIVGLGFVGFGKFLDSQAGETPLGELVDINIDDSSNSSLPSSPAEYKTNLTLITINETEITLSDYAGKVIILYFHFIDCPYCVDNGKNLNAVMGEYSSDDLFVVAIDVIASENAELIQEWASEMNYTWTNVHDKNFDLSIRYGITATPTMFVLDQNGKYSRKFIGITPKENIRKVIDWLLI
jgi:peroxiredoxin